MFNINNHQEMQVEITVIYYYIPIGMAKIENTGKTRCW